MKEIDLAKYNLLYYGMKYEWVREKIEEENIDFGVIDIVSNEIIEDHIDFIKNKNKYGKTYEILKIGLEKEKNPIEQAKILQAIIDLKKNYKNNGYEVEK